MQLWDFSWLVYLLWLFILFYLSSSRLCCRCRCRCCCCCHRCWQLDLGFSHISVCVCLCPHGFLLLRLLADWLAAFKVLLLLRHSFCCLLRLLRSLLLATKSSTNASAAGPRPLVGRSLLLPPFSFISVCFLAENWEMFFDKCPLAARRSPHMAHAACRMPRVAVGFWALFVQLLEILSRTAATPTTPMQPLASGCCMPQTQLHSQSPSRHLPHVAYMTNFWAATLRAVAKRLRVGATNWQ